MSIETGVMFNLAGEPIHWHLLPGRTSVLIPDTYDLWQVFWEHRNNLGGFAHSHPGTGFPYPSITDLTTFSAVEKGLGDRLLWPIISEDCVSMCFYLPKINDYKVVLVEEPQFVWLNQLRKLSYKEV